MRILEIITVPFFAPRGTSFSALHRTQELTRMGHTVQVLAYPLGDEVPLDGAEVHRLPSVPGIRSIPMGPSWRKLLLDLLLALKTAWWLLFRGPWDLVHVHEEAAYWVAVMKPLYSGAVLYDMHSSLPEQLKNYGFGDLEFLRRIVAFFERAAIRRATAVIVICPALEDLINRVSPGKPTQLIENLPVSWDLPSPSESEIIELAERFGVNGRRTILYTGTFSKNQGLELAVLAMNEVVQRVPEALLLLVGGRGKSCERLKELVVSQGLSAHVIIAGPTDYRSMPALMSLAEVLLSPRTAGTNTPLKIYSYLASGKPIVATALSTHTQALSEDTALLARPNPSAIADAIVNLLQNRALAQRLGGAGAHLAETRYGIERYRAGVRKVVALACSKRGA